MDTSVYNAARICKLYGTMACKGDEIPGRPHRLSAILEAPQQLLPVPRPLLEKIAGLKTTEETSVELLDLTPMPQAEPEDGIAWMDAFLRKHHISVRHTKEESGPWTKRWILEQCPSCGSMDKASCISVDRAGKYGFRCQHARCTKEPRKGWQEFRKHYEPEYELAARKSTPSKGNPSAAQRLVERAVQRCTLFTTPAQIPYASFRWTGRMETHKVASKAFRRWLATVGAAEGSVPSSKAIADAMLCLEARAFAGPRHEVYLRFARQGNVLYVDLNNAHGEVVEVTAAGWKILSDCAVPFVRPENMAPLPQPVAGGILEELRQFINVTEEDFALVRGFLLDCYKGQGPYLVALITGEQGSAKSTTSKLLRR